MAEGHLDRIETKIDALANALTDFGVRVADRFVGVEDTLFALDQKVGAPRIPNP